MRDHADELTVGPVRDLTIGGSVLPRGHSSTSALTPGPSPGGRGENTDKPFIPGQGEMDLALPASRWTNPLHIPTLHVRNTMAPESRGAVTGGAISGRVRDIDKCSNEGG